MQEFDFSDPTGGSTYRNVNLEDAVVKCAPYHTYGTRPLSQATLNGLGRNHAVLMANHGAVVVGENMEMALYNAERLERECEIYWRCLQMQSVSPPQPLTLTEIRDLQKADETYGQEHPDKTVDDAIDDAESDATPDIEALSESPSSTTSGSDVSDNDD